MDDTTTPNPADSLVGGPTPATRKRRQVLSGVPIRLSDHREWTLAFGGLAPALDQYRDHIYDMLAIKRMVPIEDCVQAAWILLVANYDLSDDEAFTLLSGLNPQDLANAVTDALFGPEHLRRTYSRWAYGSLIMSGIEPSSVPPELLPTVLDLLVKTGRTLPHSEWIESAQASVKRANLLSQFRGVAQAKPKP